MAEPASAMATAALFRCPVRALCRLAGAGRRRRIATCLWWPISSAHRALFWALVVLVALHLSGAALSFAARPSETLFRITRSVSEDQPFGAGTIAQSDLT